jgi:hypothetical protein
MRRVSPVLSRKLPVSAPRLLALICINAPQQIDKSLLLLFFRKEESSFLKERSKELLLI